MPSCLRAGHAVAVVFCLLTWTVKADQVTKLTIVHLYAVESGVIDSVQLTQSAPLLVQLAERQWGASATLPLSILPGALSWTYVFCFLGSNLLSYYMLTSTAASHQLKICRIKQVKPHWCHQGCFHTFQCQRVSTALNHSIIG